MTITRLANLAIAPLVFIVPLLAVPDRLVHPAPWLGLIAAAAILLSQPEITAKAMVADREDQMSALAIFAGQIGAQFVAILQFGYWLPHPPRVFGVAVVTGTVLVAGGLALRLWAIRTLGRWFTSTVMVQDGQTVVESGPYRVLRHPSYTGALLTALGVTIALASVRASCWSSSPRFPRTSIGSGSRSGNSWPSWAAHAPTTSRGRGDSDGSRFVWRRERGPVGARA